MTERKEKHKQKFKERGITLIALVITIIVLLILAGVALAALTGDSGILNNTESAKIKTNLANAQEQVKLAILGAKLENMSETGEMIISYNNLKKELDNIIGNEKYEIKPEEEADSWTVTLGEYEAIILKNGEIDKPRDIKTLAGILTTEGTTPWLPEGFSRVTKFTQGLVISNTENGTEGTQNYVWIEVPTTISASVIRSEKDTTVTLADAQNNSEILEILEVYVGKGTTTNYRDSNYKDEWYDSNNSNVVTETNKEDTAGCGMTYSQYQIAYSNMLNSIKKYGGFWLAQYEAGIEYEENGATEATNRREESERILNPTSANYAKDQYPYNWVYCSEAQKIANVDSTDKYTSSLPFGIQWDLVFKFLEVKKAKKYEEIAKNSAWGNYVDVGWTSEASSKYSDDEGESFKAGSKRKTATQRLSYILTTGGIKKVDGVLIDSSPMEIFDLAGNLSEWSLERGPEGYGIFGPCTARGGSYGSYTSVPACKRTNLAVSVLSDAYGFRSVLF